VNLRATSLAFLPICLLLTGCPLTDHYQLQQEGSAAVNAGGSSGGGGEMIIADAGELAIGGAPSLGGGAGGVGVPSDAGGAAGSVETAGSSGGPSVCANTCNAPRNCVSSSCESGWVEMGTPPSMLVARSKAASVAIDKAVFVWGGQDNAGAALANGAIYYPATDTWKFLPLDAGSPSARIMATAVWTGSASNKVIVFGGTDVAGGMVYRDGAVYDVTENSWMALPVNMMVSRRSAPYGYWDGARAVFFGGLNGAMSVAGADRFDFKTWSISTKNGDPGLIGFPATAFDGTVMYLQGGVIGPARQDKVYSYTSSTDTWASLSKSLSVRTGAFGAWDGTHFVVWGGQDDDGLRNDGKAMSGMTWSDMSASNVLSARRIAFRRSGWAFQAKPGVTAIIGGQTSTSGNGETLAIDGATYAVATGEWTAIPSWPSDETHEYGIGVWTGEEFVVWGGRHQNVSTLKGERWAP